MFDTKKNSSLDVKVKESDDGRSNRSKYSEQSRSKSKTSNAHTHRDKLEMARNLDRADFIRLHTQTEYSEQCVNLLPSLKDVFR